MDTSLVVALVGLVTSLGGIFIANRYTARTARQAQTTTAEIEQKKLDVASWQDQVKSWRDDVQTLREQRAADKAEYDREISKCNVRITELEEGRRADARQRAETQAHLDAVVAWGRMVVMLLHRAGIAYPAPPPGIQDTDPGRGTLRPVSG